MKRIAMLLVALGLAAPAFPHERSSPQGCDAIEVTAPGLAKQPRNLRFSPRTALDLEFEARLERAVYGEHVLRFKVYTPSGFLYQELAAPFRWRKPWGPKSRTNEKAVPVGSYPAGLAVQELGDLGGRGRRFRDTLRVRLPVAGTSITMSTLYGRWTVQAFLDDKTRPCSPLRSFTIQSK